MELEVPRFAYWYFLTLVLHLFMLLGEILGVTPERKQWVPTVVRDRPPLPHFVLGPFLDCRTLRPSPSGLVSSGACADQRRPLPAFLLSNREDFKTTTTLTARCC